MARVIVEAGQKKTVTVTLHKSGEDDKVIGKVKPGEVQGFDVDDEASITVSES